LSLNSVINIPTTGVIYLILGISIGLISSTDPLEIHTLAVPACSLFQTPVTGDLRLGVSPFARAMVPGIVLAPQCSAQPDEIMEDAPSFPEQGLFVGPNVTCSVQPQLEEDLESVVPGALEEARFRNSYHSWTGFGLDIPRSPNRVLHEDKQCEMKQFLTKLQEKKHVLKTVVGMKRKNDFGEDANDSRAAYFPNFMSKLFGQN